MSIHERVIPLFWATICMMEKIITKIHIGLRWPPFSSNTQQPTNSRCGNGEEEIGDETRGVRAYGSASYLCLGQDDIHDGKLITKIHRGRRPPFDEFTHNNEEKLAPRIEDIMEMSCDRLVSTVGCNSIVLGAKHLVD